MFKYQKSNVVSDNHSRYLILGEMRNHYSAKRISPYTILTIPLAYLKAIQVIILIHENLHLYSQYIPHP